MFSTIPIFAISSASFIRNSSYISFFSLYCNLRHVNLYQNILSFSTFSIYYLRLILFSLIFVTKVHFRPYPLFFLYYFFLYLPTSFCVSLMSKYAFYTFSNIILFFIYTTIPSADILFQLLLVRLFFYLSDIAICSNMIKSSF